MKTVQLKNREQILMREAEKPDAAAMIEYVKVVADETDFLTFPTISTSSNYLWKTASSNK